MATPLSVPSNAFFIPVNLSSSFKTFTLPVVSTNPGRMIIFKDAFGNAVNSSLRLSTIGMDRIERSTVSSLVLSNAFGAWTFANDGLSTWYLTEAYLNTLVYSAAIDSGAGLYVFTSNTFTTATATGRFGPTLAQIQAAYSPTQPWATNTLYLNMSNQGIQLWTVPTTASYSFTLAGASGGFGSNSSRGLGAIISLNLSLTLGNILAIAVGQRGGNNGSGCYGTDMGGGGGGTFVYNITTATWLAVAGGGGGGGTSVPTSGANASLTTSGNAGPNTNGGAGGTGGGGGGAGTGCVTNAGNGGAGITGNGSTNGSGTGGSNYANGLAGGAGGSGPAGGFGGGGGVAQYGGGGGGGYSGGGGGGLPNCSCSDLGLGGGGGSYGLTSFITSSATNTSDGYCTVVKL